MNEDRATLYQRLKRRASIASLAATAVLLTGLLVTDGSANMRDVAVSLSRRVVEPHSPQTWIVVACYVITLGTATEILTLAISFYQGFLLERRYGLSTEGPGGWLREHSKGVVLGLVFATLAAEVVYFALRRWPDGWWAVSGGVFSLTSIVLVKLAPVLLLPIFYRFTPLDRVSLRGRLVELARRAGVNVLSVYVWSLGDRTRKANAALAGLGRTRRVLLSDTMLSDYTDDEIEVILAHELAHHIHRDIWKGMTFETALTFVAFYLAHHVLRVLSPVVGLAGADDIAGLPVLLLTGGTLSVVMVPLANAISRHNERQADRYALEITGNPDAFVSAMRRLGAQNLAESHPSRLVEWLFHTHPVLEERIAAAQAWKGSA